MTLRTRLLIGYGYLALLLVITAVSAATGFFGLSKGIDRILEENFASVESSTRMLESLERQDSATFKILLGQEQGEEALSEADAAFDDSLQRARSNITIEEEHALIEQIERDFETYREARDELIQIHPDQPLKQYNREVFPLFVDVKDDVLKLLDVNHAAMVDADRRARSAALRNGVWLGVLVTIGLLSLVFLTRALQTHLLSRLSEFEETTQAIVAGDEFRRLPDERDDELGVIARNFNDVVDRLDEVRGEARGRIGSYKGLVMGLLAEVSDEAILLGLDGSLISSTLSDSRYERLLRHHDEIKDRCRKHFKKGESEFFECELEGSAYQFELVESKERRPVGWLGRIIDRDEPASESKA